MAQQLVTPTKFVYDKDHSAEWLGPIITRGVVLPAMANRTLMTTTALKRRRIAGRAYIQKKLAISDYISKKYGVTTVVKAVELTTGEKVLEGEVGTLLELVDKHLAIWDVRPSAVKTRSALSDARRCLFALLDAVHMADHRLERICVAIYGQDLRRLIKAIRSPKGQGDHRALVQKDRTMFKRVLRDTVLALRNMCLAKVDANFVQFVRAPRPAIEQWCNETIAQVEALDEAQDLDNEDNIAAPAELATPPMYN